LTLASCEERNQSKKRFPATELKYSAYGWFFDDKVDSFDFLLVHYVDINKDGKFNIMRRDDGNGKPLYFTGYINDTIRKIIDTVLATQNYKSDFLWNVDDGFTYDGYTYTLDFTDDSNKRKFIHYIPNKSPLPITKLGLLLDTLVYAGATQQIDTLNIDTYMKELKSMSWAMMPPPKVHVEKAEFKPPKISE